MRIGRRASTLLTDSSLAKPIGEETETREGGRPAATQQPQPKKKEGTETREGGRPAVTQQLQSKKREGTETREEGRQAARTREGRRGSTILTGSSLAKPIGEGTGLREEGRPAATQEPQLAAVKKKTVRPPTMNPVIRDELFDELGFDPKGPTEGGVAFLNPLDALKGDSLSKDARKMARYLFPGAVLRNDTADAFRHALWSFLMTRELGPEMAKRFGDAHEISKPNPDDERLMDLYNNHMGRVLALDPRNKGRPAEDVILEAIRNGQLQTLPFTVQRKPGP